MSASGRRLGTLYPLPEGATAVTGDSGNQANAVAVATLAANPGGNTWIQGFDITASGATAGLDVTVTVAGITTPLHYTFTFPAGALVAAAPLSVRFPVPIKSSALSTAITVTLPASGVGGTNATVVAYGYQF